LSLLDADAENTALSKCSPVDSPPIPISMGKSDVGEAGTAKLVEPFLARDEKLEQRESKVESEDNFSDTKPISSPMKFEPAEPVDWDYFRLLLLERVFFSECRVFGFEDPEECSSKIRFGDVPCECLLCSFPIDAQRNLFYHWRKTHRGISMSCAMCNGRFLFVGALFSHLCLGTANPIVAMESFDNFHFSGERGGGDRTPSINSAMVTPSNTATSSPVSVISAENQYNQIPHFIRDGELGAVDNTIVLRYQCALCDGLELPGFFNYMVHLRKDHTKCELCLETLGDQKQLEHHMKKHKLNHFCWKCGVTYCTKPNFMTHLFWKHGTESEECSKCLKKKWPHIYHYCLPPLYFKCEVCDTFFSKAKYLIVHRRIHSKEKLRKCPKHNCTETFISKRLLEKHLENGHNLAVKPDQENVPTKIESCAPGEAETSVSADNQAEESIRQKTDGVSAKQSSVDLSTAETQLIEPEDALDASEVNKKGPLRDGCQPDSMRVDEGAQFAYHQGN